MSKTWQSIGPHRFCTEGDTIYWSMVGFMEEAHTKQLLATVDAALAKFHRSVLLVDCTLAHGLKPEARRCYAEWLKHNPIHTAPAFSIASMATCVRSWFLSKTAASWFQRIARRSKSWKTRPPHTAEPTSCARSGALSRLADEQRCMRPRKHKLGRRGWSSEYDVELSVCTMDVPTANSLREVCIAQAPKPPSTLSPAPVTLAASSLARYATRLAT